MESPNDEFSGIEFECPQCRTALDRYYEACPHCGHALGDEYCARFRLPASRAVKIIALLLLVIGVLIPLAGLLWFLLL